MSDDLDISSEIPERVRLEVRGPSGRMSRENLSETAVVLDLSTVTGPGERTFTFADRDISLPTGVSFYKAVPSQITVRFEHLMYKNVPVRARYATGPPDGYAVVKSSFDPQTVRIVGPESHVQPIDYVSTDPDRSQQRHRPGGNESAHQPGRSSGALEPADAGSLHNYIGKTRHELMARQLFGTDGIRGVAGEYPLDPKTVTAAGSALGKWIAASRREPQVVIGMDTRESGPALAAEIAGGLALHGVGVDFAGVTTTPGVAYLAKNGPFAAGVMISASHNPYRDNGIKVLGHSGYKLPDEQEEALEEDIFACPARRRRCCARAAHHR